MNVSDYAKHQSVARNAVYKAIERGRLLNCLSKNEKGHWLIDVEIADNEWEANLDPANNHSADNGRRGAAKRSSKIPDLPNASGKTADSDTNTLVALKAKREAVNVKKAMIELAKMEGKLVEKEMVHKVLFAHGQQLREALLSIPDRLVDDLLACRDRMDAHKILYSAIEQALTDLASVEFIETD